MRKILLIFAVAMLLTSLSVLPVHADMTDDFAAANKSYQDKDYAAAIGGYESVVGQGLESAALYFNLGNAYFKSGDLGNAVLYYMRAQRLDPGDDDITHNLEFARGFTSVQMEGVRLNPVQSFFESLVAPYRLSLLAWVSSAFFVFLLLLMILRWGVGITGAAVRAGLMTALILVIISSGLTTFKYRTDYLSRRAVIITEDSPVQTGPSEQSDVELQGAPGLVVEILAESDDYYNVLFENKRRGWINKRFVAEI